MASSTAAAMAGALTALQPLNKEFVFPVGLIGFPYYQHYKLELFEPGDGSESPFLLLSSVGQEVVFPLIHPLSLALDYRFPASPELLAILKAQSAKDLVPLLIVTVREKLQEITVNLQGPVILHPKTCLGAQLVLEDRPLRYPLLKPTAA